MLPLSVRPTPVGQPFQQRVAVGADAHCLSTPSLDVARSEAATHIPWRYVSALVYPIAVTIRPFLEQETADPTPLERMQQAWLMAVLLHVTLWSQPYLRDGAW